MEESIAVLSSVFLIISTPSRVLIIGIIIQCRGRERTGFDGGAEGLGAHLGASRLGRDEAMFVAVESAVASVAGGGGAAESGGLSSRSGCSIGNRQQGNDGTENDRCGSGAASTEKWVALFVIWLHGDGGHGEVGTVDGDHS